MSISHHACQFDLAGFHQTKDQLLNQFANDKQAGFKSFCTAIESAFSRNETVRQMAADCGGWDVRSYLSDYPSFETEAVSQGLLFLVFDFLTPIDLHLDWQCCLAEISESGINTPAKDLVFGHPLGRLLDDQQYKLAGRYLNELPGGGGAAGWQPADDIHKNCEVLSSIASDKFPNIAILLQIYEEAKAAKVGLFQMAD